jgi:hypothetical protein
MKILFSRFMTVFLPCLAILFSIFYFFNKVTTTRLLKSSDVSAKVLPSSSIKKETIISKSKIIKIKKIDNFIWALDAEGGIFCKDINNDMWKEKKGVVSLEKGEFLSLTDWEFFDKRTFLISLVILSNSNPKCSTKVLKIEGDTPPQIIFSSNQEQVVDLISSENANRVFALIRTISPSGNFSKVIFADRENLKTWDEICHQELYNFESQNSRNYSTVTSGVYKDSKLIALSENGFIYSFDSKDNDFIFKTHLAINHSLNKKYSVKSLVLDSSGKLAFILKYSTHFQDVSLMAQGDSDFKEIQFETLTPLALKAQLNGGLVLACTGTRKDSTYIILSKDDAYEAWESFLLTNIFGVSVIEPFGDGIFLIGTQSGEIFEVNCNNS